MTNQFLDKYNNFIGVDETGVGDYFSPIISVACFVLPQNIDKLLELKVNDSKKLSDNYILQIAPEIKKLVKWKKTALTQKGYNNLIKANINNNEIKTLIHFSSINNLLKIIPECLEPNVLIDQYVLNEQIFENHFNKLNSLNWISITKPNAKIELITKAESIAIPVACASIIARSLLLETMQEQNKNYKFDFPLGASNKVIEKGKEFIKTYSIEKLNEVAKVSFKTTKKILEEI